MARIRRPRPPLSVIPKGYPLIRAPLAAVFLALAACAPMAPEGHRAPGSAISSMALFDPAALAGTWHEAAGYPLRPGCRPGTVTFAPGGSALSGSPCFLPLAEARLTASGPGRFRAGPHDLWVLWADADNRTLVLGTPSGSFAAVLDRGQIAPDRLEAARRVLAFNGYRTDQLSGG